jgi:hypothetical protein
LQLLISAVDEGNPRLRSEEPATVEIRVHRNLAAPTFLEPDTYAATINENLGEGNEVTRVRVEDTDEVVSGRDSLA